VQLRPGVRATEDELLSFARDQITERAAIPKAIRLVTAMPLTGVGKIFKPELRQREIADALSTALHDAGAPASRIDVINDPRFGIQVEVAVAGGATAGIAHEVLGQFPFRCEVSLASRDQ
jgi:fatty-acyl-CoA synthase